MNGSHLRVTALTVALLAAPAAADLSNGDFGTGDYTDWVAFDDAFVTTAFDGVGTAAVSDGDEASVFPGIVEQTFTLPTGFAPGFLNFELEFESDSGTAPDLLQVELFKGVPFSEPELFVNGFGYPTDTFLRLGIGGIVDDFGGGTVGGPGAVLSTTYSLPLSGLGLSAGDEVTFSFLLLDDSFGDDFDSTGYIDNVGVTPIPAPGSTSLAMLAICLGAVVRRRLT